MGETAEEEDFFDLDLDFLVVGCSEAPQVESGITGTSGGGGLLGAEEEES